MLLKGIAGKNNELSSKNNCFEGLMKEYFRKNNYCLRSLKRNLDLINDLSRFLVKLSRLSANLSRLTKGEIQKTFAFLLVLSFASPKESTKEKETTKTNRMQFLD